MYLARLYADDNGSFFFPFISREISTHTKTTWNDYLYNLHTYLPTYLRGRYVGRCPPDTSLPVVHKYPLLMVIPFLSCGIVRLNKVDGCLCPPPPGLIVIPGERQMFLRV